MLRERQNLWTTSRQFAYFSFLRFVPRNLNSSSGSWYIYITSKIIIMLDIVHVLIDCLSGRTADCYLVENLIFDLAIAWNEAVLPKVKLYLGPGHYSECMFLPKFRCELNPIGIASGVSFLIEKSNYFSWCTYRYHEADNKTFQDLKNAALPSLYLNAHPPEIIRSFQLSAKC